MLDFDMTVYVVHGVFWSAFGLSPLVLRGRRLPSTVASKLAAKPAHATTARFSWTVLGVHVLAFTVMYVGIARAVFPRPVPVWFPSQRLIGSLVILSGAVLVNCAMIRFQSWRFRAKLTEDHTLATGGPFHVARQIEGHLTGR
jgi:hypothetical protein